MTEVEQLCWSLEKIMLARQGCLAEGLPIDYGFFLIFPERALLIFLEAYEKKRRYLCILFSSVLKIQRESLGACRYSYW